jgi:general secretion pathway protein G
MTLRTARPVRRDGGFTIVELIIATGLLMILASAALPLARVSVRRQRESELRRDLRDMRTAIDTFHADAIAGNKISTINLGLDSDMYPPDLQTLVDGVQRANVMTDSKIKYLRRIPIDPITGNADWGMRATQDPTDAAAWGGGNVWDVFSKAQGTALDGTKYKDW